MIFQSPGRDVLDMPDNLCVSPRGALVLCEDGETDNYVRGLTTDGRIFDLAKNAVVLDGERNGFPATTATGSSRAPPTAPTAAGSSSTSRPPASPSP